MDLVLTEPYRMLEAYGSLGLKIFFTADDEGSATQLRWQASLYCKIKSWQICISHDNEDTTQFN